jgi:phosphopantothenoylcysteine decarboxylase / phosphopantothenate---cysteine ligase
VLAHARKKLAYKGCDLLVVNDVSHGTVFGADDNAVVILQRAGGEVRMERTSKVSVAERIWDCIQRCWSEAAQSDAEPDGITAETGLAH